MLEEVATTLGGAPCLHRTTLRRGLVAALLPLGLLGLSACGSENATKASSPSTSTTASVPTDSGAEVDVQEFVAMMAASFDGASTATVRMELTGGPSAMSADGAIDYSASPPAMVLNVTMGDPARRHRRWRCGWWTRSSTCARS